MVPGVAPFTTSTVNWVSPNVDIANSGSSQLTAIGDLNVALGGSPNAAAHVILDITGYYERLTP